MNNDAVRVNRIELRTAMPSLLLLETVRLAFSVQCLAPAFLSLLLFAGVTRVLGEPLEDKAGPNHQVPGAVPVLLHCMHADAHTIAVHGISAGLRPWIRLSLCMILIGLTGVAVSRASGLRICADRRSGFVRSMRHALRRIRSILVSCILLGLLCGIALGIFRLLLNIPVLASEESDPHTLWSVPAWVGAMFLITVAGVCSAGWLLSLSAIGVDCCDGPESLSRGISYVLSRFRRSFCYAVVISLMTWFLSAAGTYLLLQAAILTSQSLGYSSEGVESIGSGFIPFRWFVVESSKLSVVFSAVTISYILLRQAEDGVDLQEVTD